MFNLFKKHEEIAEAKLEAMIEADIDPTKELVYSAYTVLSEVMVHETATMEDLSTAIKEALGYLGQIEVQ